MAGSGGRATPWTCQEDEVIEEMKRIPARYIPHRIRMKLSKVLDPIKVLPDRDYRSFADRNDLPPQDWEWLDSQKVKGQTSSICMVLDHLISERGNRFTVFNVYKTLVDMESDAQDAILEGMPEIRRMYSSETRPGQEHTEPSSLASPPQHSMGQNRPASPPPPYSQSERSHYVHGESSGYLLNDLGGTCRPLANSDVLSGGQGRGGQQGLREQDLEQLTEHKRPVAGQVSFSSCEDGQSWMSGGSRGERHSAGSSSLRLEPGPVLQQGMNLVREEPCEDSWSFTNLSITQTACDRRSVLSSSPPSYAESQLQHSRVCELSSPTSVQHPALSQNPGQPAARAPTDMEELKLPLQGPVVQVGADTFGSPDVVQGQSTPYSQGGWSTSDQYTDYRMNIRLGSAPEREVQGSVVGLQIPSYQENRVSAPYYTRSSYDSHDAPSNRNSDGHCRSHTGACGFGAADSDYNQLTSPAPLSSRAQGRAVSTLGGEVSRQPHSRSSTGHHWQAEDCGLSYGGHPLDDAHHQTDFKQPLLPSPSGSKMSYSMPYMTSIPPEPMQRQASLPVVIDFHRKNGPDVSLPSKFVFILAADIKETELLNKQVLALSGELSKCKISHIAVTSTFDKPIVCVSGRSTGNRPLNGDAATQRGFMATCFKKAAIVLMMVSPGYLQYADAYTEGAREAKTEHQKLIRGFHEELKDEFFNRTTSRVWPVLCLKATRLHLPSFLSDGIYYFYPRQHNSEDLLVLLNAYMARFKSKRKQNA